MASITFDWTNIRCFGLVGFEGEDLGIDGVVNEGNLVHVDPDLIVPDGDGVSDIDGDRWELSARGRSLAGWD